MRHCLLKVSDKYDILKYSKNLDRSDILHFRGQDELSLTAMLQVDSRKCQPGVSLERFTLRN